jgi:hypothetical protein
MTVASGAEGTNWWVCENCGDPCDAVAIVNEIAQTRAQLNKTMETTDHKQPCACGDCADNRRQSALAAAKELPEARRSAAACSVVVRRCFCTTPYTDEQARENKYSEGCWGEESCVPAEFARGLERGRDAARDVANWLFVRLRSMSHDFDLDGIRERCAELAEEYAWLDSSTNAIGLARRAQDPE